MHLEHFLNRMISQYCIAVNTHSAGTLGGYISPKKLSYTQSETDISVNSYVQKINVFYFYFYFFYFFTLTEL